MHFFGGELAEIGAIVVRSKCTLVTSHSTLQTCMSCVILGNSLLHIPFCLQKCTKFHISVQLPGHGIPMEKVGVHFHDTYGQAGSN